MSRRRVAIVGGGVAGVGTADELRRRGYDGDITLIERDGAPYDRPPLSKAYLSGAAGRAELALQPPGWYAENAIDLRLGVEVTAVRASRGGLELSDGTALGADQVVLATGGVPARPPVPGADGPRVHVLRTVEDADALRAVLVPGGRLLVVGAGLIGAEAASTAAALGVSVTLVDPVAAPLSAAVGPLVARWLHEQHAARGITTLTAGLAALADGPHGVTARLDSGRDAGPFDGVLLGVGMVPVTGPARSAGVRVDAGIVVDARQRTSVPEVLAVGDPTRRVVDGVPRRRAEHWDAARLDAARAAAAITGTPPPEDGVPWFWTDRHGVHVEVVGAVGGADRAVLRGDPDGGSFSVLGVSDGRVVGAACVDDTRTARAARRLADRRIPVDPDLLADPASDLRRLLRATPAV